MPDTKQRSHRVVPLDADRLGHIAGALGALPVALIQMFVRDADLLTTLVRSGWIYVGIYAAVFMLVRLFLRASLYQMLDEKRSRREDRRRRMKERQAEAKTEGPPITDMLAPGVTETGPMPPSASGLPQL